MDKKELIKKITYRYWKEIITLVITIIFLILLNNLNNELLSKYATDDYLNILIYEDGKPVRYFIYTLLLVIIEGSLVALRFKEILHNEDLEIQDAISNLISILISIFLIIMLIHAISNPILKAILVIMGGAVFVTKAGS